MRTTIRRIRLAHIMRYSQDPNVICRCRLAFNLWCLGYPDQAQTAQSRGLAQAQALAHPFSLGYALTWDAMLHGEMGNIDSLLQSAEAAIALGDEHHLRFWSSWATVLHGWALAEAGEPELGLAELQRGGEQMHSIGGFFLQPFRLITACATVRKRWARSNTALNWLVTHWLAQHMISIGAMLNWSDFDASCYWQLASMPSKPKPPTGEQYISPKNSTPSSSSFERQPAWRNCG